jgi:protein TIF31
VVRDREPREQFFHTNEPVSLRERLLGTLVDILEPDTHGLNLTSFRDWNEEFFNFLNLPNANVMMQIQRAKILSKLQGQFVSAAKKLARAIFQNTIQPLNPSDVKSENCYVFNNLFATFAVDSVTWELPKTDTSPSTYSTVNNDIRNLQQLYRANLQGVNTINTCSVDFLCQRVVVQTVIQGILHFDQKTWGCYGSIDDGKTMCFTDHFHALMASVCNSFGVSLDRTFKDAQGKEFKFHGSPEVKGIKAGDGRQYLMDLMRLSPRDTNYPDPKLHECCIMRNELVRNFLFFSKLQKQYSDHQK